MAKELGIDIAKVPASGRRVSEDDVRNYHESRSQIIASPLARRMAEEEGIDLSQIKGSGPGGRIVEDDVLPRLSLAVDGLTDSEDASKGKLVMPSEDTIVNETIRPSATMPVATLDPEILEVYGWESSLWRKIRSYLGF